MKIILPIVIVLCVFYIFSLVVKHLIHLSKIKQEAKIKKELLDKSEDVVKLIMLDNDLNNKYKEIIKNERY